MQIRFTLPYTRIAQVRTRIVKWYDISGAMVKYYLETSSVVPRQVHYHFG